MPSGVPFLSADAGAAADPVTSLAPTRQSDSLLVSTLDSTLRLMDRRTGRLLRAYAAPDYVNAAYRVRSTLGLNDSVVVSGSEDGTVFVWDLLDGSVRHRLRHGGERGGESAKRDVVSAVAFCRARREWVSAGGDGESLVWFGLPLEGGDRVFGRESMLTGALQGTWSSGACRNE